MIFRKTDPLAMRSQNWRPHYESRPYTPAPGRREHIHGPVHEMRCKCGVCRKVAA